MAATQVHSSRLAEALETQEMLLREERARTVAIEASAQRARDVLQKLSEDHRTSVDKQAVLTKGISIYQDLLKTFDAPRLSHSMFTLPIQAESEGKIKPARIGKQHYRMLHALRNSAPVGLADLAGMSRVLPRRAKAQMAEDIEGGLVILDDEGYRITVAGDQLFERFQDYRKANNIPLPSLEAAPEESEQDEAENDVVTPDEELY